MLTLAVCPSMIFSVSLLIKVVILVLKTKIKIEEEEETICKNINKCINEHTNACLMST